MKKILFVAVVALAVWQFVSQKEIETSPVEFVQVSQASSDKVEFSDVEQPKPIFTCDGRQHCSQMNSYEEAKFFIDHCPDTKMDGDRDGIPCERQFNR